MATIARTIGVGYASALWLGVGLVAADTTYLLTVVITLGTAADLVEPYLPYVKWLGGAYLAYIGYKQFIAPPLKREQKPKLRGRDILSSILAGYAISGTNPKVVVFYLSLLPLFVDISSLTFQTGLITVLTVVLSLYIALLIIVFSASIIAKFLDRPGFAIWLNRVTGVMMILVGGWVALS